MKYPIVIFEKDSTFNEGQTVTDLLNSRHTLVYSETDLNKVKNQFNNPVITNDSNIIWKVIFEEMTLLGID